MSNGADQDQLELFRDSIRRFAQKYLQPDYEQWEKEGMVPREF